MKCILKEKWFGNEVEDHCLQAFDYPGYQKITCG